MRRKKHFLGLLVTATAVAVLGPRDAWTVQLFDPASFGTGVYVGPPPGGQLNLLGGTTPFKQLSTENVNTSTTIYQARAHADFQGFEVGGFAGALAPVSNLYASASGGARAYTGLTVSTDTPVQLTGSISLDGSFGVSGNDSASLALIVQDISGLTLADVELSSDGTSTFVSCDPPGTCTSKSSFGGPVWSVKLPFVLPTLVSTGIAVGLDSFAVSTNGVGASADFLNTATLNFTPPPGVTVTLATGQTFVGTPEPGTLLLLGSGLAGLAAIGARRRRV